MLLVSLLQLLIIISMEHEPNYGRKLLMNIEHQLLIYNRLDMVLQLICMKTDQCGVYLFNNRLNG